LTFLINFLQDKNKKNVSKFSRFMSKHVKHVSAMINCIIFFCGYDDIKY